MDRNQFVSEVRERAGIESVDEAARAIDATFRTLAERIVTDEALQLASQLPTELADSLTEVDATEAFDLDEFVGRVGSRAGVDEGRARQFAQAVFSVTSEAVTAGEWSDVCAELPDEYQPLLVGAR